MAISPEIFSTTHFTTSGKAPVNGIELYYEVFGQPQNPAIVLIMGLDAQCYLWAMPFIEPLVEAGYQVVRFDNRDIGHSTWLNHWRKSQPYTIEDMATDVLGLLDHLHIAKAHIIGASMGGMIAQRLAISHSHRLHSLTCLMSTGWALDPSTQPTLLKKTVVRTAPLIIKYLAPRNKFTFHKLTLARYLATYRWLAGTKHPFDRNYFTNLFTYLLYQRQGQNPRAMFQQFCAVMASGSRLKELHKINLPTLALHGTADKLVPLAHAQKYSRLIPGCQLHVMDGIGHEIPRAQLPSLLPILLRHLQQAHSSR
jgi:pimeloyl-ACP methyl ester carboxylesterase